MPRELNDFPEDQRRRIERTVAEVLARVRAAIADDIEIQAGITFDDHPDDESDFIIDVVICERVVEVVGGAEDGQKLISGFALDVKKLLRAFDRPTDKRLHRRPDVMRAHITFCCDVNCGMQSPHVSFHGQCHGHNVSLHLVSEPMGPLTEDPIYRKAEDIDAEDIEPEEDDDDEE